MALLDRLKQALGESRGAPADPEQARRIAAAVLLLAMAHADTKKSQAEYSTMRAQLQTQFGLSEQETDELIATASDQARESVSLYPYLKALNDGMPMEEKRQVLAMLWHVAYADRHLDPHEEYLMRELADLLHLPHREFIRTKLAVLGES
ncbi:MAG TPA: TerB family tellurite resistance protein [Salinisphaeraceae bacterium]|nr:TerB family tellurite resistance protein [Salinisphaeraceae bacterium]